MCCRSVPLRVSEVFKEPQVHAVVLFVTSFDMWHLVQILAVSQLWFSDGNPIAAQRGGHGVSSRLMVDGQGFLDVTEIRSLDSMVLDANGATLWLKRHERYTSRFACPSLQNSPYPLSLSLRIDDDGNFNLSIVDIPSIMTG